MGGSRCTYRNCTVRSDGAIHMFHYPVYDKIRCHQWLVNAQRLDFLNLKLSQVRNRVVCQHHFKDECFMNYKKEKLIFDAIPTEDGPFCKSIKDKTVSNEQLAKVYSIALSDLEENDKYSKKTLKANKSMIYADFLTNGDAWEKRSLNETIWNNMVITKKERHPQEENKTNIDWPKVGRTRENQNSMISLTDLIGDTSTTQITEFENPLLANINFNEIKECGEQQDFRKKTKKDQYYNKHKIKGDVKSLVVYQGSNNEGVKQEQNVINSVPDPDLSELLLNQENNMVVDFNNATESNNSIIEKIAEMIPADQDIQNLINIQNKNQSMTPVQLVTSTNNYCAIIQNPNVSSIELYPIDVEKPKDIVNNCITIDQWKAKKPKITILSEKTISNPVLVKGKLEPLSPSTYIHLPKKSISTPVTNLEIKYENNEIVPEKTNLLKQESTEPVTDVTIKYNDHKTGLEEINTNENIPPLIHGVQKMKNAWQSDRKRINKEKEVIEPPKPNPKSPKPPIVKHKIAPERVAAIEKKRNFNKKLRDIIEICLEKLDDQDKTTEVPKVADSQKVTNQKEKVNSMNQNIATYLSKQAELPSAQEYMMKFLEARMKKMEDVLLGKIEQNSQRIVELKNSISKSSQVCKVVSTQTPHNEESYKKQLYQEISKFLSPNANSLIYEELFINKFAQKLSGSSPKRRKQR